MPKLIVVYHFCDLNSVQTIVCYMILFFNRFSVIKGRRPFLTIPIFSFLSLLFFLHALQYYYCKKSDV